jgi:hypothetical protein
MLLQRRARLFKNGRNQSVRIPREFEMPGTERFPDLDDPIPEAVEL